MTPSPPRIRVSRLRRLRGRIRGVMARYASLAVQQFITRNRRVGFLLSVATVFIAVASVAWPMWWFSPGVMILPILGGGLLLWPRALRILFGIAAAGLIYDAVEDRASVGIAATIVITAIYADVLANTRGKLGTRGRRADRMMIELRDRIRAQGTLPDLGSGWGSTVIIRRPAGRASAATSWSRTATARPWRSR